MTITFIAWAVSAVVIGGLTMLLGRQVVPPGAPLGIFVDNRGRFSLTHFQIVTWSIVILSLISGVFWGRLLDGAARIAATDDAHPPRPAQIFLQEEGDYADRVIDVTKFQSFIITLVLVVAYVALAADTIHHAESAKQITSLPSFSGTFLTLLGASHAAYVIGKVPSQAGTPDGPTVATRLAARSAARASAGSPP